MHVAAYIEQLQKARSAPTAKLRLAALRYLFDWLVVPIDGAPYNEMKAPPDNGMMAPPDSEMIPPPCNGMIPPG